MKTTMSSRMSRRVLSLFLVTLLCVSLARVTAFATESVTCIDKVAATNESVNIGTAAYRNNFYVAIKQAQKWTIWTASDLDQATKNSIISAVIAANNQSGTDNQGVSGAEFHVFTSSMLNQPFNVFSSDGKNGPYSGQATIKIIGDNITFQMSSDKWSHLLYGTYPVSQPPVTPATGSLTVTKNVSFPDGVTIPDNYKVTVTVSDGTTTSTHDFSSFTNNSASYKFENLPVGTYTVSEVVSGIPSNCTSASTSVTTATATVSKDTDVSAVLTNNYSENVTPPPTPTEEKGSLTVTKNVSFPDDVTIPDNYNVTVTVTNGTTTSTHVFSSFTNNSASYKFENLPIGTYTVSEVVSGIPSNCTSASTSVTTATATVSKDTDVSAVLTNNYSKNVTPPPTPTEEKGSLTVTKNVSFPDDVTIPDNYNVTVTVTNGTTTSTHVFSSFTNNSASYKFENLPVGTYTVSEVVSGIPSNCTSASTSVTTATATVSKDTDVSAVLTNNYSKNVTPPPTPTEEKGSLTVTKFIPADDFNAVSGLTLTFTLTDKDGKTIDTKTLTVNSMTKNNDGSMYTGSVSFTDLTTGSYTVTETSSTLPTNYTVAVTGNNQPVSIEAGKTAAANFTNDYTYTTPSEPTPTPTPTPTPETPIVEPEVPLSPVPETPATDVPDVTAPTTELPGTTVPTTELPDEETPLASVPKTGDAQAVWLAAAVLSGMGLAWTVISGKKRERDAQ
jgi:LPXTG-motif cell wall-anchored protein